MEVRIDPKRLSVDTDLGVVLIDGNLVTEGWGDQVVHSRIDLRVRIDSTIEEAINNLVRVVKERMDA